MMSPWQSEMCGLWICGIYVRLISDLSVRSCDFSTHLHKHPRGIWLSIFGTELHNHSDCCGRFGSVGLAQWSSRSHFEQKLFKEFMQVFSPPHYYFILHFVIVEWFWLARCWHIFPRVMSPPTLTSSYPPVLIPSCPHTLPPSYPPTLIRYYLILIILI